MIKVVSRLRMVVFAVILATIGVLGPYPGGETAALAAGDVGYRDHSFAASGVSNPTGEKPQSKLWFNDGLWWASLFNRTTEEYHIYRYESASHAWSDTGTLIDERNSSKADTLWDGTHLYVVSAGADETNSSHGARVLRYSYDPATKRYTLDQGFPVTITSAGLETIVLDKDTTGKLWVTYEQDRRIYANRTLNDDRTWGTPFVLPVKGTTVTADDISAVVAFDSQIGVMWSNQRETNDAIYFATHRDGDADDVWQVSRTAIQGPKNADDHISLRSLQAADSSGRVFAAVKTSLGDLENPNPNAPLILLLARDRDGNWTNHVFGRVGDDHTRPIVMLDEEHRDLYMFATAPCCTGGAIYYKKTSLSNISFSEGPGEPFIQSSTDQNINDATSTKQNLSSATGLMVMASSGTVVSGTTGSGYYWHNAVGLGGADNIPPETTIDSGPSGTVDDNSATFVFSSTEPDSAFECAIDGASFNSCTSPQNYTGLSEGSHTFQVRATDAAGNTDATPASGTWTVDTVAPSVDGVAPTDGATDVAVVGNVEATFSEALDASTISGSTFTLTKQGTTPAVEAAVSYEGAAKKATLDPDTDLQAGATYVATVEGGANGIKDSAGNPLAADRSWAFTTEAPPPPSDTTNPTITLTTPAEGTTYSPNQGVNAAYFCQDEAGGSGLQSCTGTVSNGAAIDTASTGTKTFTVTAMDNSGNQASVTHTYFVADTTAPETAIDSGPSGTVNVGDASFEFTSSEPSSTFECSLDGDTFTGCSSPKDYIGLSDGTHTFQVRAIDAVGNTDTTPAERSWTVDSITLEAPVINSPADNSYNNTGNFSVSGTAEPGNIVELFDGAASVGVVTANAGGDWSKELGGVPEGSHTYTAKTTDAAGNTSAASNGRTIIVDMTPPETAVDSGPSSTSNIASATFAFSSTEPDTHFECALDGTTFSGCTSPKDYANLSAGAHTFEVRATDVAGNTDPTPAKRTWTVDTAAPVVQPPTHNFVNDNLGTSTVPVKLTWSATDDNAVAGYQLQQSTNGGAYQGVALPSGSATITRSLTPGNTYQFRVRAQDQAGNWSSWTLGARFGVDAYQESDAAINYVDLWATQTDGGAYGGALKYAKGLGTEKATFVFTGSEVGWVSSTNKSRGQADVYLDGTKVATVDLYSNSGKSRVVVFSKAGLDPSVTHTLEVRVLGAKNEASKDKRVDVDAFVVLR